jgi:hypothetical protein
MNSPDIGVNQLCFIGKVFRFWTYCVSTFSHGIKQKKTVLLEGTEKVSLIKAI